MITQNSKIRPNVPIQKIEIVTSQLYGNEQQTLFHMAGKIPLLYYNGIHIKEISDFILNTDEDIPYLDCWFKDTTNSMNNSSIPRDNTIISIFIDGRTKDNSKNPNLSGIRMDFKILDFNYDEEYNMYYIKGVPNIDMLFVQNIKSYGKTTSLNTLKQLASDLKIGFSSNLAKTNDNMVWSNYGFENILFMKYVSDKSYISDSSFTTCFIDYYYNLNYVDIDYALKEDISEQKGIITVTQNGLAESESQVVANLILTTQSFSNNTSNLVIESWQILNQSTRNSIKYGYHVEINFYDKSGNWSEKAGTFNRFILESETDGKGIIMKSYNNADTFFKNNIKKFDMGDLDVDNVHKQYNYSSLLNEINKREVEKLEVEFKLKSINFNFNKYQKIKTLIYSPNGISPENSLNARLSGEWLIKSINFRYTPESGLKQSLICTKRELGV